MKTITQDRHVERCRLAMSNSAWWTLRELAEEIGCSEAAASARIRDLRKQAFGAHRVISRHIGPGGRYAYRLLPDSPAKIPEHVSDILDRMGLANIGA